MQELVWNGREVVVYNVLAMSFDFPKRLVYRFLQLHLIVRLVGNNLSSDIFRSRDRFSSNWVICLFDYIQTKRGERKPRRSRMGGARILSSRTLIDFAPT